MRVQAILIALAVVTSDQPNPQRAAAGAASFAEWGARRLQSGRALRIAVYLMSDVIIVLAAVILLHMLILLAWTLERRWDSNPCPLHHPSWLDERIWDSSPCPFTTRAPSLDEGYWPLRGAGSNPILALAQCGIPF